MFIVGEQGLGGHHLGILATPKKGKKKEDKKRWSDEEENKDGRRRSVEVLRGLAPVVLGDHGVELSKGQGGGGVFGGACLGAPGPEHKARGLGWLGADPCRGVNVMTCASPLFSLTTRALHLPGWPAS